MKILLVDMAASGHRYQYNKALISCCEAEFVLVTPEKTDLDCRQYVIPVETGAGRTLASHRRWIRSVGKVAKEEKPDLIHFLYGDGLYKFFGYGVGRLPCKRKITTLHMVRQGRTQALSLKMMSRRFDAMVVHSRYLKEELERLGIRNAVHIEYPHFNRVLPPNGEEKAFFGLADGEKVIACIGATRSDKGLDILLEALNRVTRGFRLLVAGSVRDIDEDYIREHSVRYRDSVRLYLKYLTDEELDKALAAADIICLPYRKWFNGASGPLGEGVSYGKCIVGPDHGNLGSTIRDNHLGYTFRAEDPDDLARALNLALEQPFRPDGRYLAYQKAIDLSTFRESYAGLYHP